MRFPTWRGVALVIVSSIVAVGLIGCDLSQPTPTPAPPVEELSPVTAKATILPSHQAKLSFETTGRLAALPKVGERVTAGQEIARLDTTALDLAVTQAEDAVAVSRAVLAQAKAPARDIDIAALESAYQAAVARQNALLAGGTTADVEAATAALSSAESALTAARARLQQVLDGSTKAEVAAAESAVSAAASILATARQNQEDLDPASKRFADRVRAAQFGLETARNTLWSTQVDRDATKGLFGADSAQGRAADARVAAAETAVSQAQSALDQAKTPPTDDAKLAAAEAVESAGSALASASANLQRLRAGAANADVAAAQSAVSAADAAYAAAKARLDTLKIGGAPGDKETSAAQVAQAKAALELRKSGPVKTDLDVLDAQAKLAETALAQAKASRRSATIVSPIAGVVVSTSGNVGETIVASTAVVVVADLTTLRVETTDLDEAGAAMLKTGMPTKIRINAFTDKELTGKVDEIASVATTTASGDANYVVIIVLDQPDPSLKIGMTARVEFPVGR